MSIPTEALTCVYVKMQSINAIIPQALNHLKISNYPAKIIFMNLRSMY